MHSRRHELLATVECILLVDPNLLAGMICWSGLIHHNFRFCRRDLRVDHADNHPTHPHLRHALPASPRCRGVACPSGPVSLRCQPPCRSSSSGLPFPSCIRKRSDECLRRPQLHFGNLSMLVVQRIISHSATMATHLCPTSTQVRISPSVLMRWSDVCSPTSSDIFVMAFADSCMTAGWVKAASLLILMLRCLGSFLRASHCRASGRPQVVYLKLSYQPFGDFPQPLPWMRWGPPFRRHRTPQNVLAMAPYPTQRVSVGIPHRQS
jgi:hypothetical protein